MGHIPGKEAGLGTRSGGRQRLMALEVGSGLKEPRRKP